MPRNTEQENEADRIQRVYRDYEADPRVAARWDPNAPGNRENVARRESAFKKLLQDIGMWPPGDRRVLEIGCGEGAGVRSLVHLGFHNIQAIDFRESAVENVKRVFSVATQVADATALPCSDRSFDFVSLFTVFSSVSREMQKAIAKEVDRVLRPGGAILWYDMRYPNPANRKVRPVSLGALRAMFPVYELEAESATLIPQLARHLPFCSFTFPFLHSFPLLRSHWIAVLQKPRS